MGICSWDLLFLYHFYFVVPGVGDVQYKHLMHPLLEPDKTQIHNNDKWVFKKDLLVYLVFLKVTVDLQGCRRIIHMQINQLWP